MAARIVSVNVGKPRTVPMGKRKVRTGIFKSAVPGRVAVGALGLAGDGQADPRYHGGPEKAVYAYCWEHYERWSRELGRSDLAWGQFGENLTIEGLLEEDLRLGDRLAVAGGLVLKVTEARVPCFKLGLRMDSPIFPKLFANSLRCGYYLAVVEPGEVGAGDTIEVIVSDPGAPTVRASFASLMKRSTSSAGS